ncbi:MAG: phosphoribosylglycinamide formyltransferase [Nitriliruptorales bacterium]|nr:phosphoribosylglycinamide formyltransferase [Nitriliruptorales bacterium]
MGKRLVVLASGHGSNAQALFDRDDLGGDVAAVVADVAEARVLHRAEAAGIEALCVDRHAYGDRSEWEAALVEAVAHRTPDLVILAGFMRILSGAFVRRWPTLNVHPSLLPSFPGAHAVEDALAHGVKLTGVTVHFVVEEVDAGPIVMQEAVGVEPDDTPETLHNRLKAVEHRLLPAAVGLFCADRLDVVGRNVRIKP